MIKQIHYCISLLFSPPPPCLIARFILICCKIFKVQSSLLMKEMVHRMCDVNGLGSPFPNIRNHQMRTWNLLRDNATGWQITIALLGKAWEIDDLKVLWWWQMKCWPMRVCLDVIDWYRDQLLVKCLSVFLRFIVCNVQHITRGHWRGGWALFSVWIMEKWLERLKWIRFEFYSADVFLKAVTEQTMKVGRNLTKAI